MEYVSLVVFNEINEMMCLINSAVSPCTPLQEQIAKDSFILYTNKRKLYHFLSHMYPTR